MNKIKPGQIILVKASNEYRTQIIEMLDEWSEYNATHNANKSPSAIFRDYQDFDSYIECFKKMETNPEKHLVHASTYFALDTTRNIMVGAVQIRHYLNEHLRLGGGHIGDGVRPSERRKGYATEMIGLALEECKKLGIDKVMMSCSATNLGSKKSIINNGGVLDGTFIEDDEVCERYWIDLSIK